MPLGKTKFFNKDLNIVLTLLNCKCSVKFNAQIRNNKFITKTLNRQHIRVATLHSWKK